MTVSYVERDQADTATLAFYDAAEARFQALLNIFKTFSTRLPRVRAIPQIFVDGEHIGGLEDLRLHLAGVCKTSRNRRLGASAPAKV